MAGIMEVSLTQSHVHNNLFSHRGRVLVYTVHVGSEALSNWSLSGFRCTELISLLLL